MSINTGEKPSDRAEIVFESTSPSRFTMIVKERTDLAKGSVPHVIVALPLEPGPDQAVSVPLSFL